LQKLTPKPQRAPPPPPTFSPTLLLASKVASFLIFGPLFPVPKKRLNFGSAQNAQKSQKSDLGSFLALFLIVFWTPFGTNFLNISRFPENLYFATCPQRNSHFPLPNPLILEQIFDQILMFFQVSFSDILFSSFFQHDTQKHDFWTPLEIQLGPKWRPKSAKWRKKARKKHKPLPLFGAP
jgi:hypothetical protein